MRFATAVDLYVADMQGEGRFTSRHTELSYRVTLRALAEDVGNRDPRLVGREDIQRCLTRWPNPNSRSVNRSHLVSFFDWLLETGLRKDNPARQTRRPRPVKPIVYRLTRDEVRALRSAATGRRETAAIDLGVLAGLRAQELCGFQGRHLRREGWVWVSADIGKGRKERWVPVLAELEPVWQRLQSVGDSEFVLPGRLGGGAGGEGPDDRLLIGQPMSTEALRRLVGNVGRRAGIAAGVRPHMLRHAFADHIARFAGIRVAQFVLGHSTVGTTETYLGPPTLEEIRGAVEGFGYGQLSGAARPLKPVRLPVGGLPAESAQAALARVLEGLWANESLRIIARGMRIDPTGVRA